MEEKTKGFQVACRILQAAPALSHQLRAKLAQRGFAEEVIEYAIEQCEEYGYLDDERLIERYIEKEFSKGRGPYLIAAKLREKAGSACDRQVFAIITKEREREMAQKLLSEGMESKKLYQRGFSSDVLQ